MDTKLHAKIVTMAAATLGLSLVTGCAKKAEPAPAEGGATAAGAESSCGAGSCGAAHHGESTTPEAAEGTEPATGAVGAEGEVAPESP